MVYIVRRYVEYIQKNYCKNTANSYLNDIYQFINWFENTRQEKFEFSILTEYDLKQYRKHIQNQYDSQNTIERKVTSINKFLQWADAEKLIKPLKMQQIKNENYFSLPLTISKKQRNKLLRYVYRTKNLRDILVFELILRASLKVSDLCSLKINDVQFQDNISYITIHNPTRILSLGPRITKILKKYLVERNDSCPYVIVGQKNKNIHEPISRIAIYQILKKYAKEAGFEKINANILRNTSVAMLIEKHDIQTAQKVLGHKLIATTARYIQTTEI
ncbi:tyrosine-type recombinase/integrase [Thermotalea metallivorans]|uniref:Tyrosine recombinase XerC n=1 Tax=Thermotalea metallivorans TaxID=520762 RepID=A0A140KZJ8_9FIRM|nr:tyrosine-type recombinase/integrase [Thermotalea metallivorans]KXG73723.1 Tyrosine recombinase XerC [Thermotalea metallivorans]